MVVNMSNVGKYLKELRKKAGMTQEEVAKKLGMARATYASLEAGRREPDLGEIKAIADLYEITMMHIVAEEGEDWPDRVSEPEAEYKSSKRANSQQNFNKAAEVLLLVLGQVGAKPNVGEAVIYKLLYFIDANYLEKYGKPLTGIGYVHSRFGPSPTQSFLDTVKNMQSKGELEIVSTKHFNNTQKKYLPLRKADLQGLSASEYVHIIRTLAELSDETAEKLNEIYLDVRAVSTVAEPSPNRPTITLRDLVKPKLNRREERVIKSAQKDQDLVRKKAKKLSK